MKNHEIFFADNIRFLRGRKGMTQEELAKALNISRVKLNALESGRTKAPPPEDYLKFSDFFHISVDTLLKIDVAKLGELKLRDLQAGNDVYMTGSKIRVLAITVDQRNRENVEYVPVKAKAGYLAGYSDPDFIAGLPRYSLPNLPKTGTYRIFPTTGDSMLPIPEGADIITEYIADWKSIKPRTSCVVILKGNQDFVFKQVTPQLDGLFLLESYNPLYAPYTVAGIEILEIWKYYKHQTSVIPDGNYEVKEIRSLVQEVLQELKKK